MKKMIAVCFLFAFLLAVVAGCPQPSGDTKSGGAGSSTLDDPNAATVTSSDDASDAPIEL